GSLSRVGKVRPRPHVRHAGWAKAPVGTLRQAEQLCSAERFGTVVGGLPERGSVGLGGRVCPGTRADTVRSRLERVPRRGQRRAGRAVRRGTAVNAEAVL